jgi:integrase
MRQLNRLTDLRVKRAKRPGMYADGLGLYLRVAPGGSKQWIYRYVTNGKMRDHGIGPYHGDGPTRTLTLADAREKATEARKLRLDGIDPIAAKRERRASQKAATAKQITFKECCAGFLKTADSRWSNPIHRRQWEKTLAELYPTLGELPVGMIDKALVIKALEPIWERAPVTGSRLRGRLESVLAWATVRDFRSGDNPAAWHLMKHAGFVKAAKIEHHAALPYAAMPAFMSRLRKEDGQAARALEFIALTAARAGEAIEATWSEIDLAAKTWVIPAERMKMRKEHRVPLSDAAVRLLKGLPRDNETLFPGLGRDAVWRLAARLEGGSIHGIRSTFRDWAAERTSFPREIAEMALAHSVGTAVERAYSRTDLFDKRRKLMDAWAEFCAKPMAAGQVVAIGRRG